MVHLAVYEALKEIADKSGIKELSAEQFVLQQDALERLSDDDSADEAFADYFYQGGKKDDDLPFELVLTGEGFAVMFADLFIGAEYADFANANDAAQAIFRTCTLFLNGQIRIVLSVSRRGIVAREMFLVVGIKQEPLIAVTARSMTINVPFVHRNLHTHVLRNHVLADQFAVPGTFYAYNKKLATAYKSANREIDWGEPAPLTKKTWQSIINELTWHETGKKPLERSWVYALKQWETWVFTLMFGGLFIALGLALPHYQAIIRVVSQISFVVFVFWFLPLIAQRKYTKQQANEQQKDQVNR